MSESALFRTLSGVTDDATQAYKQAFKLFDETDNHYWAARTLNNLGRVYDDLGDLDNALKNLENAVKLRKRAGDLSGEAITLNAIGAVFMKKGEYRKALEYYQTSFAIRSGFDITNDRYNLVGQAIVLNNIGRAFDELGKDVTARRYLLRALKKRREAKDRRGEAITLNNLGLVENDLGNADQAIIYYEQSLKILGELGIKKDEAQALNNLSVVYIFQNRQKDALEKLEIALKLYTDSSDFAGQSTTLNNIVTARRGDKDPELTIKLNQALLLARRSSERSLEARTLNNLMTHWIDRGNFRVAAFYGKQSVNLYQEIRSAIHEFDESVRRSYLKSVTDTYRTLADVLIGLGQYDQASQVLKMLKAEEYYRFVQRSNKEIKELDSKVNLTEAEKELIEKISKDRRPRKCFEQRVR